jgi:hypothetical protein
VASGYFNNKYDFGFGVSILQEIKKKIKNNLLSILLLNFNLSNPFSIN